MLKDILIAITRDGYISKSQLAKELDVSEAVIDGGIDQLIRMGYLIKEETGLGCSTACGSCPFARTCGKEIIKTFKISEKGSRFIDRN